MKQMKNTKILIFSILVFILAVQAANATLTSTTGSLKIISLKYEPYPVEPGEYFDMWIKLENSGVAEAKNVSFEIKENFPFSVDEETIKTVGRLDVGDEVVLKYKIRVDEDAVEGENDLWGRYCVRNGLCINHNFNVTIRTSDAIIAVADVKAEPSEIAPGEEALVKITLNNIADSLMKNIRVKLDLYEKLTTSTSITFNELPFTPIGSTNELSLKKLQKGESEDITFKLIVDPDAEPGIYKIPVILSYSDEIGTNYTRNYITALLVNDKPKVYSMVEMSEIYQGGGAGIIDIKFINKGLTDVKFLDVELKETEDYKLLSSPKVYIGNLNSDDYETAEYKILVKKTRAEKLNLSAHIVYRDAVNNEYEEDIIIPLILYNAKYNGNGGIGFGSILFILIIIGAGIFLFKRWKRKKKKK